MLTIPSSRSFFSRVYVCIHTRYFLHTWYTTQTGINARVVANIDMCNGRARTQCWPIVSSRGVRVSVYMRSAREYVRIEHVYTHFSLSLNLSQSLSLSLSLSLSHGHTICRFLRVTHTRAHTLSSLSFPLSFFLTARLSHSFPRTVALVTYLCRVYTRVSLARAYYLSDASLALEADRRPKATTLSCGRTLIVEREVKCGAPLPGVLVVGAKPTV